MGKGKNKWNGQKQQGASSSVENSGQEQTKEEEMTETISESNKSSHTKGVIVLKVFIHCQGCADTIYSSLRGFEGVEVIEVDSTNHKVTVKGAKADPLKVLERVRKKCRKHVELVYPKLKNDKKEEKKEDKKPKIAELIILKVNLHCPSCATEVKQRIHKLEGVHTVETDLKNSIVKVMGTMNGEKIVELMKKKEGRHATVLKQQPKKGENKEGEQQKGGKKQKDSSSAYPNYPPDLVYASQLFSDENPNACSIM